jgi:hypothetical protein
MIQVNYSMFDSYCHDGDGAAVFVDSSTGTVFLESCLSSSAWPETKLLCTGAISVSVRCLSKK